MCDKTFNTKDHFKNHTINNHSDENSKAFPCKYCTKTYTSSSGLTSHNILHHPETRKYSVQWYECDICDDFKTPLKHALFNHKKTHSTKTEVCEICKNVFPKYRLKHHIKLVHSGNRHKCEICHLDYSDKEYLTEHWNSMHGTSEYICNLCDMKYSHRSNLISHKKKKHSIATNDKC